MGYPNPAESPFDLFMTGHAGCAPSTALGLKVGDEIAGATDRHAVAVIGDGALPSGIVFEAFNHASGLRKKLLVILNDNKMSICPRVGGLADYLDRAGCPAPTTTGTSGSSRSCPTSPWSASTPSAGSSSSRTRSRPRCTTGCSSRSWGFVYFGPIDGHDLKTLRSYLERVKALDGPVLLHVLTNKGHGFEPAVKDPVKFHAPAPFQKAGNGVVPLKTSSSRSLHRRRQRRSLRGMPPRPQGRRDHRRHVRGEQAPEDPRHLPGPVLRRRASARATRWPSPPAWPRPAPGRSSTSTARSSSDLTTRSSRRSRSRTCRSSSASTAPAWSAPTGRRTTELTTWLICASSPTWSSWPRATRRTSRPMFDFALRHTSPVAIRYPRANLETIEREVQPIELGQAEILEWETDGMLLACGTMVGQLLAGGRAAARAVRPAGRRGQRPVRQAAGSRHDRQGDRGVRLRADGRGRLPHGRLRLGGARGGQRGRAAHHPRPPARPARPLRPPRRARRTARRGRPRRRGHHPGGARLWPWPRAGLRRIETLNPSPSPTASNRLIGRPPRARGILAGKEPFCDSMRSGSWLLSWNHRQTPASLHGQITTAAAQTGHPGQRDQARGPALAEATGRGTDAVRRASS